MGSVSRSSCAKASPCNLWSESKKCRMKERAALGSEVGRKGRRRNGMSKAARGGQLACATREQIAMASCMMDPGNVASRFIPLDFSSRVQPLRSSCTSSGSTDVRVHASSHRGFGSGSLTVLCCAPFDFSAFAGPSLPFRREKKLGIVVGCLFVYFERAFGARKKLCWRCSCIHSIWRFACM